MAKGHEIGTLNGRGGMGDLGKSAPEKGCSRQGRCALGELSRSKVTVGQYRGRGQQQVIGPDLTSPGGRGQVAICVQCISRLRTAVCRIQFAN